MNEKKEMQHNLQDEFKTVLGRKFTFVIYASVKKEQSQINNCIFQFK